MWSDLPVEIRALAEQVLKRKQLDCLRLSENGGSLRAIGTLLDISPWTVRGHLEAAGRKLEQATRLAA